MSSDRFASLDEHELQKIQRQEIQTTLKMRRSTQ